MRRRPETGGDRARLGKLVILCARSSLLGGVLSIVIGAFVFFNPGYYLFDSPLDYLALVAEGAALLAILGGIAGLHLSQRRRYGRLGRIGALVSAAGLVMAGAGHLIGLPFFVFVATGGMAYVLIGLSQGVPLVWGTVYLIGAPLLSLGLVLLGIATLRAGTLPPWCGPILVAGLAGLWILGNALGWISFGLAWLAVGYALRNAAARTS